LRFVTIEEDIGGNKLENGSWNGGLGLFERKVIIRSFEKKVIQIMNNLLERWLISSQHDLHLTKIGIRLRISHT